MFRSNCAGSEPTNCPVSLTFCRISAKCAERREALATGSNAFNEKINKDRYNDLSTQTIVFNLSESLANPNRLKEVELSQNPLSYIDSV